MSSLQNLLNNHQINHSIYNHSPQFTIDDARKNGKINGIGTKSLFLKSKNSQQYYIYATMDDERVDMKSLAESLGEKRLSFGSDKELYEILKILPGAVGPMSLINDQAGSVRLVFDSRLVGAKNLHIPANSRTETIRIDYAELVKFMGLVRHK